MRTRSVAGSTGKFASRMIRSARPLSPTSPLPSALFVPTTLPSTIEATTKAVHIAIAHQAWVALQRAIRTVNGFFSTT
jgi:hypothetical protein